MKKILLLTVAAVLMTVSTHAREKFNLQVESTNDKSEAVFTDEPTPDDAVTYNDAVIFQQKRIIQKENQLIEAIVNKKEENINILYKEFVFVIKDAIKKVKHLKAHSKFNEFRKASLKLFKAYLKVVQKDYGKFLKAFHLNNDFNSSPLVKISTEIDDKLSAALEEFSEAQEVFAEKLKFELEDK